MGSRIRRVSAVVVFNLFLIGVCVELGGALIYYGTNGNLIYTVDHSDRVIEETGNPFKILDMTIHPYFGFTSRISETTNNDAFKFWPKTLQKNPGCCDFPMQKRADEVLVGIFGGSVAGTFTQVAERTDTFKNLLSEIPRFSGKKIRVLQFAYGGYKQPQQALIFAYYLMIGQPFDVVINIDGFNELVSGSRNMKANIDITFPPDDIWGNMGRHIEWANLPFDDPAALTLAYHKRLAKYWRDQARNCGTGTCYLLSKGIGFFHGRFAKSGEGKTTEELERKSHFVTFRPTESEKKANVYELIANLWMQGSKLMEGMANAHDILYFHVIQPNQWWQIDGSYEPMNPNHPYSYVLDPVEYGYPELLKRVPELRAAGVNIIDATRIFDAIDSTQEFRDIEAKEKFAETGTVYSDDCCHYNPAGYEILFEAVAKGMAATIAESE